MQSPVYLLLLLFIIKVQGDDKNEYPKFPHQAEFLLENFINDGQHIRILYQCYYDYHRNQLIVINQENYEYHNYSRLTKAVYASQECQIYPIECDESLDGFSAVTLPEDHSTHIRPLEDFFLLTSNAVYHGESVQRGFIRVDQWKSMISNESEIIWSFAKSNYTMPWTMNNYSIPIQRVIRRKDDGLILQVLNVFDYKPMIIREDLTPPKGIFCDGLVPKDELISLQDLGLIFPEKFSIWIDVSTLTQRYRQAVHLRYYSTPQRRLIRYDYTTDESFSDPMTAIFDLSENSLRSYQINRRTGACFINDSTEVILLRSVVHEPIETLIKYEDFFLTNPKKEFVQSTGEHQCRGSIVCETYVGQLSQFPSDPEKDWLATTIEWAWSKQTGSNYPIYLHLNLYEDRNHLPEYIHYEFYDYQTKVYLNEFDVNLCYRANQLQYEHLVFQLKIFELSPISQRMNSSNSILFLRHSRRQVTESIHERMSNLMNIDYLRISQLQLDYEFNQVNDNQTIYCIFTLLDRTPFVQINTQIGLKDARSKLENAINTQIFQFYTNDGLLIEAVPDSLKLVQFNLHDQNILKINGTIPERIEILHEKIQYSYLVQLIAMISGIIVGILSGLLFVVMVMSRTKRTVNRANANNFAFENISFHVRTTPKDEEQGTISMEHPVHVSPNSPN